MSAMPAQLGDISRSVPGKSVALRSPHDGIVCMIERQSWGAVEVEGNSGRSGAPIRRDWERAEAEGVYAQPFAELLFQAQTVHRGNCDPNYVETASLLSIKTGGCLEDCAYCAQSVHYDTGLNATRLMDRADVVAAAQRAKAAGASRFCMAAAWRSAKDRDLDQVCDIIAAVKRAGIETCVTLGMLTPKQAARLADAGLDFYNHHADTSPEFYRSIITTRTLQDRIDTLTRVREVGVKVCCGGIIGMGEHVDDRLGMLVLLANVPNRPESVPINLWNEVNGVPVKVTAERPDPIALAPGGDRAGHDAQECRGRRAPVHD